MKKAIFYKTSVLIKDSYWLVDCNFTTLPDSLLQTDGNSSLVFRKVEKSNFHNNYIFQQNVFFHTLKQKRKRKTSKKIVDRTPKPFCILSEKDRKLIVFLKYLFSLKLLLWTRSISFWQKRRKFVDKKPRNFWSMSENDKKKHNFPQRFFSSNCSYGHLESSFDISTEFPREIIKNSFSSSSGNDQKEFFRKNYLANPVNTFKNLFTNPLKTVPHKMDNLSVNIQKDKRMIIFPKKDFLLNFRIRYKD